MSVTLKEAAGQVLQINAWNWGVLHYTVVCAKPPVFDDEAFLNALRFGGATLAGEQAAELHEYLSEVVLPRLQPGQRMFYDFSVTDELDDGTFHRDNLEKNYSLSYEVLVSVIDFLREAQAPVEVS